MKIPTDIEYLPFFELLQASPGDLAKLGEGGRMARYGTAQIAGAVARKIRPLGYWEAGQMGRTTATRSARRNALLKVVRFAQLPAYFGGVCWVYRKDREVEALRRICLLTHAYESPFLSPAWEYLHGAILGYSAQDIACYFTSPDNVGIEGQLAAAYQVYRLIKDSVYRYVKPQGHEDYTR
jgi:hypothetical protein